MKCTKCGSSQYNLKDSRPTLDDTRRIRRYECMDCGNRWSTIELARCELDKLETLYNIAKEVIK